MKQTFCYKITKVNLEKFYYGTDNQDDFNYLLWLHEVLMHTLEALESLTILNEITVCQAQESTQRLPDGEFVKVLGRRRCCVGLEILAPFYRDFLLIPHFTKRLILIIKFATSDNAFLAFW